MTARPLPGKVLLSVPAQSQLPLLPNGCEVTSLSMLLAAVHHPVDKAVLAREQPTDPTPARFRPDSDDHTFQHVVRWGDPERGFVGDVFGRRIGYGIYHRPLRRFLNGILPGRAVDLTGRPFSAIQAQLARGVPVLMWDTTTFHPTDDWVTWQSPDGPVRATQYEHAVLLVGYDAGHLFVNNPLTGRQAQPVGRTGFLAAWQQLGRQALSVAP